MNNLNNMIIARKQNIYEYLLDPANGLVVFMGAIGIVYGLIPLGVAIFSTNSEAFELLSVITLVSLLAMWVGGRIRIFDLRFNTSAPRLRLSTKKFVAATYGMFIVFSLVTLATAPSIPILSALMGADTGELSLQRGAFLKGREGVEIVLLYMSAIFTTTLIPYSIVLLYEMKSSKRHIAVIIFFLFCISFMMKALFLNCFLPLLAFLASGRKLSKSVFIGFLVAAMSLLIAATFLSRQGETINIDNSDVNYFSASYRPHNPFDFFIWRSAAVPVFTAADTLTVHKEQFLSRGLLGATSSSIAAIFGIERINIERFVDEYQFGYWSEIANANSVFIIDGFVNFGWIGVIVFGLFVGQIFRWFRISQDIAFKSLWPVFAFILFSGPLLGMLLGNGFLYMVFHALFIRVHRYEATR